MTPLSGIDAVPYTRSGVSHLDTQYIAPHNIQMVPDIQQPAGASTKFMYRDWNREGIENAEFDDFSFGSAGNLTTNPATNPFAPTEVSPSEVIPKDLSESQSERSVCCTHHYGPDHSSD